MKRAGTVVIATTVAVVFAIAVIIGITAHDHAGNHIVVIAAAVLRLRLLLRFLPIELSVKTQGASDRLTVALAPGVELRFTTSGADLVRVLDATVVEVC